MYTYGFGTGNGKNKELNTYIFGHSGGGFGFSADMRWSPDSKIGCVVLHNVDHLSGGIYANQIAPILLKDYIGQNKITKDTSFINTGFKPVKVVNAFNKINRDNQIIHTEFAGDSIYKPEWAKYIGSYKLSTDWNFKFWPKLAILFGYKLYPSEIKRKENSMYFISKVIAETKLQEYLPGLFFTNTGEALDLRNKVPTYGNIRLKKY
jgi:hypothetical protein